MVRERDMQKAFDQNPWKRCSDVKKPKVQKGVMGPRDFNQNPWKAQGPMAGPRKNHKSKAGSKGTSHVEVPKDRAKMVVLHLIQSMRHFKNHSCFEDGEAVENHYILPRCPSTIPGVLSGSDLIESKNKTYARVTEKGYICEPDVYVRVINEIKPDYIFCTTVPPLHHRDSIFKRPVYYNHHGFITIDGVNKCCGKSAPYKRLMRKNWQGFSRYIGIGQGWARLIKEGVRQPNKLKTLGLTQLDFLLTLDLDELKSKILSHYNHQGPTILFAGFQGYGREYLVTLKALVHYTRAKGGRLFIKPRGQMQEQIQALKVRLGPKEVKETLALQASPCVSMLPTGVPIYYFLFADAVVVQHSGSLVVEAMMRGANVLEVQPLKRNDFLRLTKFPAIPRADTVKAMTTWLDIVLKPGYARGKVEEEQRRKFISYQTSCGQPEPDTWKKILEMMINAR
jgi:hypothetical protein